MTSIIKDSRFLLVHSHDRKVTGTNIQFTVPFNDADLLQSNIVKVCPKSVTFPNFLYNVHSDHNNKFNFKDTTSGHSVSGTVPVGFYTWETLLDYFNGQLYLAGSNTVISGEYGVNGKLKLKTSQGQVKFYTDDDIEKTALLMMLGIPETEYAIGTVLTEMTYPATFNWNNEVIITSSLTLKAGTSSSLGISTINFYDVITLGDTPYSQTKSQHCACEVINSFTYKVAVPNSAISFRLLTKYGKLQQMPPNAEWSMICKIFIT